MDIVVFLAVLAAAIMHGAWNVLVKLRLDRFLSLFLIQTLMGLMGLLMLAAFGLPSPSSYPYALISGILHTGYNLFLARSYRTGDLSQVYPIARGTAPLLTLVLTWLAATEPLHLADVAGIGVLVGGIWLVSLAGHKTLRLDGMTLFFALGTAVFIALYTIADGLGGRASGNPSGYTALVYMLDATFLMVTALSLRGPQIFRAVAPFWKSGLAGALLSAAAYWIVIWAMSKASIPAVAALRETSILFVIVMSARVLREQVTGARIAGALLIAFGAMILRLA